MNRKLLSLLLVVISTPAVAQEAGSAAAAQLIADQQNRAIEGQMAWEAAKKITLLKPQSVPKTQPSTQSKEPGKLDEGWEGELSYWEFKVLSIKNEKEMLLKCGPDVIWLVGYPTKDFTTDQKVRIVGPVTAGVTKSYETVAGSSRTVRTISMLDGEAITRFEQQLERDRVAQESKLVEDEIRKVFQGIIWGTERPEKPKSMDRRTLGRYKDELSKLERLVKGAKVNETQTGPIVYDSKKKRLELDSEKTRTIAQDLLKSLSAEIPK